MINKTTDMLSLSSPAITSIKSQPVTTTTTPLLLQPPAAVITGTTTYQMPQVQTLLQQIQQQIQQQMQILHQQQQQQQQQQLQAQQKEIEIELINRATIIKNDDEKIHIDKLLKEALRQKKIQIAGEIDTSFPSSCQDHLRLVQAEQQHREQQLLFSEARRFVALIEKQKEDVQEQERILSIKQQQLEREQELKLTKEEEEEQQQQLLNEMNISIIELQEKQEVIHQNSKNSKDQYEIVKSRLKALILKRYRPKLKNILLKKRHASTTIKRSSTCGSGSGISSTPYQEYQRRTEEQRKRQIWHREDRAVRKVLKAQQQKQEQEQLKLQSQNKIGQQKEQQQQQQQLAAPVPSYNMTPTIVEHFLVCSSFSGKKHSNNDDEMWKMNDIEYTKQIVIDSAILNTDSNSNDTRNTVLMNSENFKGHANASNDKNR
ncbi:hypothetical protein FRACYDRAFT_246880 [Fragilariopsis cylindrus CCMP1102]|uniref:Uncharacterized protein n=1 Tax=Fragilariopsis cylindrus CCMP1102 TaxID=635003 RepID=A0A1E7EX31_9STRA|nr:hypothetical protein FRACYDRAFT_246880 [Fragilariopsis cylindrus CCMP1102]|eukprot:OEU10462.1 hypothetical protein FRACYDRAFT_246880 [Fragilariopsis cylindrus CCMP1102]